jgi:hypothetical protein
MLSLNRRKEKGGGMRAVVVFCVVALCAAPTIAQHQHGSGATKALELHPGLGNYVRLLITAWLFSVFILRILAIALHCVDVDHDFFT